MKTYDTKDFEVRIRVLDDPNAKFMKIVDIQFGPYNNIGIDGEIEMMIPENIIKKKITNGSFAKHILNYFIKE